MENKKSRLDTFFSNPAAAVAMAILCNILWGSALPFIKMGYRMFAIDSADTASILCFAGVRFMMGAALVWLAGLALNRRPLPMPRGKQLASCCGLGLWQTAAQYFFYYSAAALLTGAMGGIINSTQSFMGVIVAHFLYGKADRMTPPLRWLWPSSATFCGDRRCRSSKWATGCLPLIPQTRRPSSALRASAS